MSVLSQYKINISYFSYFVYYQNYSYNSIISLIYFNKRAHFLLSSMLHQSSDPLNDILIRKRFYSSTRRHGRIQFAFKFN